MSDKEKIEAILNLLTDKTVLELKNKKLLIGDDEFLGALTLSTHVFNKAYNIARS